MPPLVDMLVYDRLQTTLTILQRETGLSSLFDENKIYIKSSSRVLFWFAAMALKWSKMWPKSIYSTRDNSDNWDLLSRNTTLLQMGNVLRRQRAHHLDGQETHRILAHSLNTDAIPMSIFNNIFPDNFFCKDSRPYEYLRYKNEMLNSASNQHFYKFCKLFVKFLFYNNGDF